MGQVQHVQACVRQPHAPAAFSMLSSVMALASATCTFSCSTSFTLSTLFITDASLSTSSRLSYLPIHTYRRACVRTGVRYVHVWERESVHSIRPEEEI